MKTSNNSMLKLKAAVKNIPRVQTRN